jgi:hypothetical protein
MAQTRAVSRALRAPLGQIVALAGYDAASAEEMPPVVDEPEPATSPADPVAATARQLEEIKVLIDTLDRADPAIDWRARALEHAGVPARMLTYTGAEILVGKLQGELADLMQDGE